MYSFNCSPCSSVPAKRCTITSQHTPSHLIPIHPFGFGASGTESDLANPKYCNKKVPSKWLKLIFITLVHWYLQFPNPNPRNVVLVVTDSPNEGRRHAPTKWEVVSFNPDHTIQLQSSSLSVRVCLFYPPPPSVPVKGSNNYTTAPGDGWIRWTSRSRCIRIPGQASTPFVSLVIFCVADKLTKGVMSIRNVLN